MDSEFSLETLLSTMTEEECINLGNEIFSDAIEPTGAAAHSGIGSEAFSADSSASLMAQIQHASGQALDKDALKFLQDALARPECQHLRCVEQLASAAATLEKAFAESTDGVLTQDHALALQQVVRCAIDAAVKRMESPSLRLWCDAKTMFKDFVRLSWRQPSDEERGYLRTLQLACGSGLLREVMQTPSLADLLELKKRFPNFSEPIEFLAQQVALKQLNPGSAMSVPPMLLLGEPGIGKSHFARALAECFALPFLPLSMSSQTNGWYLAGLDRGWGNAKAGQIYLALAQGTSIAPLVLLDEIDKANSESKSEPLGPLYQLLEPSTARRFRDEYVDFDIDASQVVWLATANSGQGIPAPLLSRFMVFFIPSPTDEELYRIAQGIYEELTRGLPGAPQNMPTAWAQHFKGRDLRAVRQLMQQAIGKAALRAVTNQEDSLLLVESDIPTPRSAIRNRIGFVC